MALDQTTVVDAIGVDNATGEVVLTITDHLEWTGRDSEHLLLLKEKLNAYLSFVEIGEMLETYPDAKGRAVLIDVVCKFPPDEQAQGFYNQLSQVVESAGIKLQQRLFSACSLSAMN
ncbi:DUF6572 domain-containing protein [Rhizobium hidalgonense]|uniref:Uncharacterized protein n=1 Tax=Rhizobium hidalgonense TaxID=1538159 RepID=A0A2A6KGZ2_9HYPH|nr:DUF6572 domain-containing protein [Rhizobium hidalgonense]MDR9771119.1 hypothetical protein [Rhizobium hidalgonense]MDR9805427.1 hypothetical protein [Rhizobium hidalgonense]MDR9809327.1 hypothetical protein [Rhizobium hidalgonense]MDR9818851.1 hypothetical protein [Rhizobium hidalgonense]PDT24054.1 hypothetical protein CO674_08165 [Rhizobium hidalgonense]